MEIDLHSLLRFHRSHGGLVSMAVTEVEDARRYGTVELDTDLRVVRFREKAGADGPGLVSGGVYVFDPAVLQHIPDGPASLEQDVFPHILGKGVYALKHDGMFIDIGTPEDYAKAQVLCDRLYDAALLKPCSRTAIEKE